MSFFKPNLESISKKDRLYLIEFRDETGYYIKCGKSSGKSSDDRLLYIITSYIKMSGGCSPYAKILRDVEVDNVFKRESEFHSLFKDRRHYPTHSVSGYTEMFKIDKEEALLAFDKILSVQYGNRETTKVCYTCKTSLSTIHFHTNNSKPDGLNHECKSCVMERQRSIKSLPNRMYRNQVEHSKFRGHPAPSYTLEEFKTWLDSSTEYKTLYESYKVSGYSKELVPSVDRIDNTKPYTFDNIELVTFKENIRRHGEDIKDAIGVPVVAINKYTGKVIAEFSSQSDAAKLLEVSPKKLYSKVDSVLTYGWLATIGEYQIVSVKNYNKFIDNQYLRIEYRYKGKS